MELLFPDCNIDYLNISFVQTSFIIKEIKSNKLILSFIKSISVLHIIEINESENYTLITIFRKLRELKTLLNMEIIYLEENKIEFNISLTKLKIASTGTGFYDYLNNYDGIAVKCGTNNYDKIKNDTIPKHLCYMFHSNKIKYVATMLLIFLKCDIKLVEIYIDLIYYINEKVEYDKLVIIE